MRVCARRATIVGRASPLNVLVPERGDDLDAELQSRAFGASALTSGRCWARKTEEDILRIRALLPLSGIGFVVLTVIGLAVSGGTPAPDAPADEVVSFYRDKENRARIGIWFFAFAMPLLPLFASSLGGLQRPEGQDSRVVWRRLLLAGAAIMSATLGVAIITQLALADSGTDSRIAPKVMQALNVIAGYVVYALLPATGTMMLGAAGWLLGPSESMGGWGGPRSSLASASSFHSSVCSHSSFRSCGSSLRASLCSGYPKPGQ